MSEEDEDEVDGAGLFQSGGVLPRLPTGVLDRSSQSPAGEQAVTQTVQQLVCNMRSLQARCRSGWHTDSSPAEHDRQDCCC